MSRAPYSQASREADGITAQIVAPNGIWFFLRRERMPTTQALEEICAEIDRDWPGWKIDVISSPTTILRDMQGTRAVSREKDDVHFASKPKGVVNFPERAMLASIGRLDLWSRNGKQQ